MLTELLLWINLVACIVTLVVLLLRHSYVVATVLLGVGLVCLAALNVVDVLTLRTPVKLYAWRELGLPLEAGGVFALYFYTKTVFRDNRRIYRGIGFWIALVLALAVLVYVLVTPATHLIFSPDFGQEGIFFLKISGFFVYLTLMLFLVFGLVQLERTLAGLHSLQRWKIKLEVLAGGLLMAAFALYFSHSLLYRSINVDFLPVRSLAATIALGMFCYSRLVRDDGSRLALSRGIAHRSFVLLLVGGYLIVLGLLGGGISYLNIGDSKLLINLLLLVGSVGLATLFLSERLRRKFKVILHKNFYQSKYDYRQQWENFTRQVADNTSLDRIQPAILDHFCSTLACKGAALYLYDDEQKGYVPAAVFNFRRDWRPFPATDPLVECLSKKDWVLKVPECAAELEGSVLNVVPGATVFLVVPLFFDDELIGFILLGEQINPDELLTYEDYDILRLLARHSVATIQSLRLSEQLAVVRELAAIGKVSTFVLHDLKNQVSGLSLLLENARDYIEDPEFQQDMLETVGSTVTNMNMLITRLKGLKEKPKLAIAPVALEKVVEAAVDSAGGRIEMTGEEVRIAADEEEIYKVVLNLLVNAIEASPADGTVRVEFGLAAEEAFVKVQDQGCGMSPEFIQHKLFKPFVSTKKHGFGIGLYHCSQIVEAHGGRIEVDSRPGEGTTFTLALPTVTGAQDQVGEDNEEPADCR